MLPKKWYVASFNKENLGTKPSLYTSLSLKGQCHEMVVEVRPWSGSLALN
jgi:hypothetical protein